MSEQLKIEAGKCYRTENGSKIHLGWLNTDTGDWHGSFTDRSGGPPVSSYWTTEWLQQQIVAPWVDPPAKPAECWRTLYRNGWGQYAYDNEADGTGKSESWKSSGKSVRFIEAAPVEQQIADLWKLLAEQHPVAGPPQFGEPWRKEPRWTFKHLDGTLVRWSDENNDRVIICVNALAGYSAEQIAAMFPAK